MDPKKVIRSEVSDAMSSLSAGARSAASLMLAGQVRRVIADRQPGCVMGFLADDQEIDFDPAITELLMNPRMILLLFILLILIDFLALLILLFAVLGILF